MELTGTNRPRTCHFPPFGGVDLSRLASTVRFPNYGREHNYICSYECSIELDRVSATMAKGKRPAPFRTRKLSPSAPMVLHW